MEYYPLFLNIRGKWILILGGSGIALRKIRLIVAAGGIPCVVAPSIKEEIVELVEKHGGELRRRNFRPTDLDDAILVFNATGDETLGQQVYELACRVGKPINTVDNRPFCTFITPALVDREPLLIALSTGGQSPVIARRLRADLESRLPSRYGKLVRFMGSLRDEVKQRLPEAKRRSFYEALLDTKLPDLVYAGNIQAAQQLVEQLMRDMKQQVGEVWLAGAGPGAVDLLTLQTLRLMHRADILLHDRLVSKEILQLARRDADLVAVGKPGTTQDDINRLMIEHARQGKRVLRLKGGDPGIYGRLAEEIEVLTQAGIMFHLAPGVTAAVACAAYAGIPLTNRQLAHGVSFLTFSAPEFDTKLSSRLTALAQTGHTLVVYMGVEFLATGIKTLLAAGMRQDTPCVVVQSLGFAEQRQLSSSLVELPIKAAAAQIKSPAIIIIGQVTRKIAE